MGVRQGKRIVKTVKIREIRVRRARFRLFLMTLILVLGYFIIKLLNFHIDKISNEAHNDGQYIDQVDDFTDNQRNKEKDQYQKAEESIDDWRILLVNADNPIPEGYSVELSNIDDTRMFDSRAVDDLMKLIEDCRRMTGQPIWPQSTYRDRDTQEQLFNDEVRKYIEEGKTREEAEKLAIKRVARPGTSEHETGLAVDFNYVNMEFEKSKAFEWLVENSHKYGFVLRYPKDKESITGIEYEPWHFRYVGKEHAKVMKENNFCLEEYVEYLKSKSK